MGLLNLLLGQPYMPNQPGSLAAAVASQGHPDFTTQVAPDPQPQAQAPIVVQGDDWHPQHPGWLGSALDTLLMLKGKQPVFQQRKAQEDLAKVMPGFASDPLQTIHRVAQIPGEAGQAYKMYDQYTTDQERDQSRNIRDAAKKDMITQRLSGMAGAATPQNFDAMHRLMVDYVKRWGEDPSEYDIPDSYDKNTLDAMAQGAISAKDQAAAQARDQALAIRSAAQQDTAQYRQQRLEEINTGITNAMTRFEENQARLRNPHPVSSVPTKYGPGMISPDGQKMIVTSTYPDGTKGRQFAYQKVNGTWVPVGETAASIKLHGSAYGQSDENQ